MNDAAIRRVVIVGGGTAGWLAAVLLAKALGPGRKIRVIESAAIGTVGVGEATIPQILHVNAFLGIDEDDLIRFTHGTYKLGVQLNNFGHLGDSYLHAFGDVGLPLGLLPFHHYWLRSRAHGDPHTLWDYSLNAAAAAQNRFGRLDTVPDAPISGIRYAYQFDASRYVEYLRQHLPAGAVKRTEGEVVDVSLRAGDGFIQSVTLASGEVVSGDFFIDCSGFRGLLIEGALQTGYETWQHWLPCDRALAVPSARTSPLRPYTQATARGAGWQWRIALQHRTGNGMVYASQHLGDDEAAAQLLANLDGTALADPHPLRFTTGMRRLSWNRNCLALGLSAGFMEPLESTTIHLVQSGVARFLGMFPDRHCDPALVDAYNRQTRFEYEHVRDFLILHYHATERDDTAFWRECAHMAVPESLARRIELFRRTGLIFREGDELFTEVAWLQVLLGQRIEPERYQPLADDLEGSKLRGFLSDIRTLVARTAARLPLHDDYVARAGAGPAAGAATRTATPPLRQRGAS